MKYYIKQGIANEKKAMNNDFYSLLFDEGRVI